MSSFLVEGGRKLRGEIFPQGAKNEALQIICATLLTPDTVTVRNVPDILDIRNLVSLLGEMGVKIGKLSATDYTFTADALNIDYIYTEEYSRKAAALRGSVLMTGPLLGRFGQAVLPQPGGDKIGRRRLDTHLIGFQTLGAKLTSMQRHSESRDETIASEDSPEPSNDATNGNTVITAGKLQGKYMLLDEASVTGTANIIMAAVLAEGETIIYNAACEPYIQQLCLLLNNMGAKITGIGSNLLSINGVKALHGATHTILPDMIEVGSFIGMAAMTGSELTIRNTAYNQLGIIPDAFRRLGICMEKQGDNIYVPAHARYEIETFMDGSIMTIADAPWPGLTPDLLSVMLVVATQAEGSVLIHQKMFESRLFFTDKLIDMGAQIILCDPHRATVIGLGNRLRLRSAKMTSPDIRAGIAMLIAAMSADGTSRIDNIDQIDRGYQRIDERLNALGAKITRV
ncbi:MAG: UDP-N-acetylglucosamine 1-carboxyvinyltransferase [Tannerella sp.]|jgi:UDP-N-acetylglucosamine 1-carboxyvinyltransferase|nr:UDP-N-acetylglucosamine 1-carboxyvinyltransferase [Tannerella sp.]